MFKKLTLAAAAGAGYVLGAKAGKERYAQIESKFREIAGMPAVQNATAQVKDTASSVADTAKQTVNEKVGSGESSVGAGGSSLGGSSGGAGGSSSARPSTNHEAQHRRRPSRRLEIRAYQADKVARALHLCAGAPTVLSTKEAPW